MDPEYKFSARDCLVPAGKLNLAGRLFSAAIDRPGVLLLPGLGFYSFEYERLGALLAAAGFNCLALDFRGSGKSPGRRGYWKMDDLVADAALALDFFSREISGKIGVFGNSLGATVAIYAAAGVAAGKVASLAAGNAAVRPKEFALNNWRQLLLSVSLPVSKVFPFRIHVNHFIPYRKILSDQKIIAAIENDPLIDDARRFAPSTYADMFSWDACVPVKKVKIPLLVIQGLQDGLQPPSQSIRLFEAAGEPKELKLINTGHVPNLESPEILAPLLIDWFGRTLASGN